MHSALFYSCLSVDKGDVNLKLVCEAILGLVMVESGPPELRGNSLLVYVSRRSCNCALPKPTAHHAC